MNLKNHLKIFITDDNSGEKVCGCGCGYVVEEKMPTLRMQEAYQNDSQNHNLRVGLPTTKLLHDGGLSTLISKTNFDGKRNQISNETLYQFNRLRIWDERTRLVSTQLAQKRMYNGLGFIPKICQLMALNKSIEEQTAIFYRRMVVNGLSKGRKIQHFIAACCYLVCKQNNIPITVNDFADKLLIDSKKILDYVYLMTVKNDVIQNNNSVSSLFISQFANKLSMKNNVLLLAIKIIDLATTKGVTSGRNPRAVCGAALYLACNEIHGKANTNNYNKNRFLLSEIANTVDIQDFTVRKTVLLIKECAVNGGLIKP